MKKCAVILLWVSLALLWILSAGPALPVYGMSEARPEGINPATELTLEAMRQSTSAYQLPMQVRVPAAENNIPASRLTPPPAVLLCAAVTINRISSLSPRGSTPLFPKAARSVDRYVYGLRKIVI